MILKQKWTEGEQIRTFAFEGGVISAHSNPKTRKEKVANSLVRKRNRQDVVTVSLSAPVQVHQRAPGTKRTGEIAGQEEQTLDIEKIEVEGYWKVLIPGEGKPWKSLQIIQVEGYSRKQHPSASRTRYRVVE